MRVQHIQIQIGQLTCTLKTSGQAPCDLEKGTSVRREYRSCTKDEDDKLNKDMEADAVRHVIMVGFEVGGNTAVGDRDQVRGPICGHGQPEVLHSRRQEVCLTPEKIFNTTSETEETHLQRGVDTNQRNTRNGNKKRIRMPQPSERNGGRSRAHNGGKRRSVHQEARDQCTSCQAPVEKPARDKSEIGRSTRRNQAQKQTEQPQQPRFGGSSIVCLSIRSLERVRDSNEDNPEKDEEVRDSCGAELMRFVAEPKVKRKKASGFDVPLMYASKQSGSRTPLAANTPRRSQARKRSSKARGHHQVTEDRAISAQKREGQRYHA